MLHRVNLSPTSTSSQFRGRSHPPAPLVLRLSLPHYIPISHQIIDRVKNRFTVAILKLEKEGNI